MSDTKTTYTPGPWVIDSDDHTIVLNAPRKDGGRLLAQPWAERVSEQKANARLIAAAPELLEALKKLEVMAGAVEMARQDGTDIDLAIDDLVEMATKARAAIAKAEGKNS